MGSKKCRGMATVATLAASMMLMGGAAFASPASAVEGDVGTTGLVPGPISNAVATARNTVAEVQRQIVRPLPL